MKRCQVRRRNEYITGNQGWREKGEEKKERRGRTKFSSINYKQLTKITRSVKGSRNVHNWVDSQSFEKTTLINVLEKRTGVKDLNVLSLILLWVDYSNNTPNSLIYVFQGSYTMCKLFIISNKNNSVQYENLEIQAQLIVEPSSVTSISPESVQRSQVWEFVTRGGGGKREKGWVSLLGGGDLSKPVSKHKDYMGNL